MDQCLSHFVWVMVDASEHSSPPSLSCHVPLPFSLSLFFCPCLQLCSRGTLSFFIGRAHQQQQTMKIYVTLLSEGLSHSTRGCPWRQAQQAEEEEDEAAQNERLKQRTHTLSLRVKEKATESSLCVC